MQSCASPLQIVWTVGSVTVDFALKTTQAAPMMTIANPESAHLNFMNAYPLLNATLIKIVSDSTYATMVRVSAVFSLPIARPHLCFATMEIA